MALFDHTDRYCDFDGAGEGLQTIYGELQAKNTGTSVCVLAALICGSTDDYSLDISPRCLTHSLTHSLARIFLHFAIDREADGEVAAV